MHFRVPVSVWRAEARREVPPPPPHAKQACVAVENPPHTSVAGQGTKELLSKHRAPVPARQTAPPLPGDSTHSSKPVIISSEPSLVSQSLSLWRWRMDAWMDVRRMDAWLHTVRGRGGWGGCFERRAVVGRPIPNPVRPCSTRSGTI
ncbi:unnamed protein product [Arctogadus glacialis]